MDFIHNFDQISKKLIKSEYREYPWPTKTKVNHETDLGYQLILPVPHLEGNCFYNNVNQLQILFYVRI